jgi:hypothetical protein
MNPTPLAPHHSFVYDGTRMNVFMLTKVKDFQDTLIAILTAQYV